MKEYEQDPFSQFEFVRVGLLMQMRFPRRLQGSTKHQQITDILRHSYFSGGIRSSSFFSHYFTLIESFSTTLLTYLHSYPLCMVLGFVTVTSQNREDQILLLLKI